MKIAKGLHENGLPTFFERTRYTNDEKNKLIQIFYDKFCETPNGARCFMEEICDVVRNEDAVPSVKGFDGEGNEIISVPEIPANPKYDNYCTQFNATAIGNAIDEYLKTI